MADANKNSSGSGTSGQLSNESGYAAISDPLIGFEFAERYKIIERIGSGGWGNVYRATHLAMNTELAIKVIHQHLLKDDMNLKRLEQEAQLLNRISSPNIIRIMDYGVTPCPFIVMEYFDGEPLNDLLKSGALNYQEALELFIQLSQGLAAAHELGFVHRDLKPGNIMVRRQNSELSSKILDFGIAKIIEDGAEGNRLTATGEVLGSPPYMAPEQWAGRAEQRSDIYSLGCIMYEVLSGKQAFNAQFGIDYLNKHMSETPIPIREAAPQAQFPSVLEDVLRKCMKKAPEQRYQSSAAILSDLQQSKLARN